MGFDAILGVRCHGFFFYIFNPTLHTLLCALHTSVLRAGDIPRPFTLRYVESKYKHRSFTQETCVKPEVNTDLF